MSGYLDERAKSVELEYAIRCDSDYLGKTIFKSFCLNILGLKYSSLEIPLSKAGDGFIGDARVDLKGAILNVEIKFSHLHPHKTGGDNWAFTRVVETKKRRTKSQFDLVFCAGLLTRDPSKPDYYQQRKSLEAERGRKRLDLDAKPHEKSFLALCAFFILPYREIREMNVNDLRPYLRSFQRKRYARFYSRGNDFNQCQSIWNDAFREAVRARRFAKPLSKVASTRKEFVSSLSYA